MEETFWVEGGGVETHFTPPPSPLPLTLIMKDISQVKVAADGWLWWCLCVRIIQGLWGTTSCGWGRGGGEEVRWVESHLDTAVLKYREKQGRKQKSQHLHNCGLSVIRRRRCSPLAINNVPVSLAASPLAG